MPVAFAGIKCADETTAAAQELLQVMMQESILFLKNSFLSDCKIYIFRFLKNFLHPTVVCFQGLAARHVRVIGKAFA